MRKHVPNILTILRFPFTIIFLYGSFQPSPYWRLVATFCFLISMLTDLLDGMLARRWHAESRVGVFLDPLADKVLVLSGFFVLLARPDLAWGAYRPWILLSVSLIALREVVITFLRSWLVNSSTPLVTSIWGKTKTTVQMVTLVLALLLLNIRDIFTLEWQGMLHVVAVGIFASAFLALFSATDYFKAARNASRNAIS